VLLPAGLILLGGPLLLGWWLRRRRCIGGVGVGRPA